MSATNHTQNYDLSQFVGGDIPSWLGDYNGDMAKIDAAIAAVASGAGDTASEVNSLKSRMTTAEADIDAAESNIATLQSTTSTQGAAITQNANNITTTNNNVSALDTRVTALEQAGPSGYDFDLTAHKGDLTITSSIATFAAGDNSVKFALNADKTIGKIYGHLYATSVSVPAAAGGEWQTIATLSSSDLPTVTTEFDIDLGNCLVIVSGGGLATRAFKLHYNTDGTISLMIQCPSVAATDTAEMINIPACIYFINEGV